MWVMYAYIECYTTNIKVMNILLRFIPILHFTSIIFYDLIKKFSGNQKYKLYQNI